MRSAWCATLDGPVDDQGHGGRYGVVVVLLAPFALIGVIAIASAVFVGRSSLHITSDGVEIRNYPQAPKLIPLARVKGFEATPRAGNFAGLRPRTAVLVLVDDSRVPVRRVRAAEAGVGVDALNRRLDSLRAGG
jgi:hypothetical protein